MQNNNNIEYKKYFNDNDLKINKNSTTPNEGKVIITHMDQNVKLDGYKDQMKKDIEYEHSVNGTTMENKNKNIKDEMTFTCIDSQVVDRHKNFGNFEKYSEENKFKECREGVSDYIIKHKCQEPLKRIKKTDCVHNKNIESILWRKNKDVINVNRDESIETTEGIIRSIPSTLETTLCEVNGISEDTIFDMNANNTLEELNFRKIPQVELVIIKNTN